ncbi:MAG: Fe-S cluster assembly protein HesB [Candidatus Thorarchaeota archaeon]|nr:Fe-S cluster assembly protein HesB [Candidatus Thorarchaeota archaeon]
MTDPHCQDEVKEFQEKVMNWWAENTRDLPWRRDPSPYNVLVSEIMLQQTQVSRVAPKFNEFIEIFPTTESLANANSKDLLKVWSGLGYNRRAIWLKEAAKQIFERGEFPQTVKELENLKGVGPYTSRSVLIFAFNRDLAAVDTNIRRVLIASGFADESMSDIKLQPIADKVLLRGRSRDWHNALMDYGAQVMTSSSTGIAPTSKQTCFEGSSRQVRGAVIRVLTEVTELGLGELMLLLDCDLDESELKSIMFQLMDDGLVEMAGDSIYRIAK